MSVMFFFFCCCACVENAPKPASARKTPTSTIKRPIKTRILKKTSREADLVDRRSVNVSASRRKRRATVVVVGRGLLFDFMLGIPCYVASLVSPFAVVSTRDAKSSSTPSHSPLPGGLVAIRRGEYRRSAGLSPRGMLALVNARFISADSGLELEIAANGDLSAGPVPRAHSSPKRRFVETSGDVIESALIKEGRAGQQQSSHRRSAA